MATTKRALKAKGPKRVDRRKTTSTRITPETRARLEEAAAQSGRSLAQEIEGRLERSFFDEDTARYLLGFKAHSMLALRCLGDAVAKIEEETGRTWHKDWDTWLRVRSAFETIVELFGPLRSHQNSLLVTPGWEQAEKRGSSNRIAGKKAVVSSVEAMIPGYMAAFGLLEED